MNRSILYQYPGIYRLAMGVLYKGRYRARFTPVCDMIRETGGTVLELCFGDVILAEYCRRHGKRWIGLDESEAFVAHAVRNGFDARLEDVSRPTALPACEVCVMMGSLYQFKTQLADLFLRIRTASSRLILSEPVRNWTHGGGFRRFWARVLTASRAKEEPFRFDEASLIETLDELKGRVGFEYRVVSVERDMVVEVIWSK